MDELIDSVKQTIGERLSSPLLSSFIVSWCLWNWKFLVILFSDADVSVTFALIDKYCFSNTGEIFYHGLLFPIASTITHVFGYPYLSIHVYRFTLKRQRDANQVKQEIANETLLNASQSNALNKENLNLKEEINHLSDEIIDLIQQRDRAISDCDILKNKLPKDSIYEIEGSKSLNVESNLTDLQLSILKILKKQDGDIGYGNLMAGLPISKSTLDFNLEQLEKLDILKKTNKKEIPSRICLTHEGKRIALSLK